MITTFPANILLDDDIDFAAFMDNTDREKRIKSTGAYCDDLKTELFCENPVLGAKLPWRKTHGLVRFREAEVSVWTGFNGSGKSLLLGQVILGLLMQGERACIASMEMRPVATLKRMVRQGEGTSRNTPEFVDEFCSVLDQSLWFYDQLGVVRYDKLVAAIRYSSEKLGCKHFIIDSLMKCGIAEDDYNGQKKFVDLLCTTARDFGIHIHLVAHSRKGKDENSPPNKMDVKGASSITDQVDNVFCVWRNKPKESDPNGPLAAEADVFLDMAKHRHGEWEGRIQLWYNAPAMQYVEDSRGDAINLFSPGLYQ